MFCGPLHHGVGHKNDHVHVGGAIVPIGGTSSHSHTHDDTAAPSDLIAQARGTWPTDEHREPSRAPDDEAPTHGFDTLAHFGAAPLQAPPLLTLPTASTPQHGDVLRSEVCTPQSRSRRSRSIRGPPASSA